MVSPLLNSGFQWLHFTSDPEARRPLTVEGRHPTPLTEEYPMKVYRIAAIPGDGIGKEVVPAGQKVLEALANIDKSFAFEFENFDWGGDYFRAHGVMMPEDGLDAIRDKDAILFGSAGDPNIPD